MACKTRELGSPSRLQGPNRGLGESLTKEIRSRAIAEEILIRSKHPLKVGRSSPKWEQLLSINYDCLGYEWGRGDKVKGVASFENILQYLTRTKDEVASQ